jgi:hypothetical protein
MRADNTSQEASDRVVLPYDIDLPTNDGDETSPSISLSQSSLQINRNDLNYCEICYEADRETSGLGCNHSFCTECISNYLVTVINDGKVSRILCPQFGCSHAITRMEIMRLSPQDTY